MSSFAEILRKIMFEKRLKAVDLAKGTNIAPSVISRYLSGKNQPSTDNIMTIGNYLGVHPQSLLSSSDAPKSSGSSRHISSDKDKIIAVQEELIKNLQKQITAQSHYIHALFDKVQNLKAQVDMLKAEIKQWEDWKASIMAITIPEKDRHAKGREKTKNPTKPNKQKVGFMKKHKKPKS